MKKFVLVLCASALMLGCDKKAESTFQQSKSMYGGKYIIVSMVNESEPSVTYDIDNDGISSLLENEFSQIAIKNPDTGQATIQYDSEEKAIGHMDFMFLLQNIHASMPRPYTIDSPVESADTFTGHMITFYFTVNGDASLKWEPVYLTPTSEQDPNLANHLLSNPVIDSYSTKHIDIHFDSLPIYDFKQKKTLVLPVTLHLERE